MEPSTASLLAEYTRRLEELPPMVELLARRPMSAEEAVERARLIGERAALTRLIEARMTAPQRG